MKLQIKPIFIKKRGLLQILALALVLGLCYSVFLLRDQLPIPTWLDHQTGLELVNQGNPQNNSVSFMVLVEDQELSQACLPKLLQLFAKHQVRATFFVSGSWAKENPDLLQGILARGHELANYSYKNVNPADLDLAENTQAIKTTKEIIKKATGVTTTLFTPPYGIIEEDIFKAAKSTDHQFVLASVDSLDWQVDTPEKIISQVLSQSQGGSLISIHPQKITLEALPTILKELAGKNLLFSTVSDNLK